MVSEEQSLFSKVASRRLFEEVCEQIQNQIETGRLKPGDRLPSERDLALQFGISRPAVREALRSLEFAGLLGLRKGPRGGSIILDRETGASKLVKDLFDSDNATFAELTEARITMQEAVIRLAVDRMTESDFKALERDIKRTERHLEEGTAVSDPSSTQGFYSILASATRNRVLAELVVALSKMAYRAIVPLNPPLNFDLVAVRRRFVAKLRERDADGAVAVMTEYLQFLHGHIDAAGKKTKRSKTP